jgi:hypothetical protein
MLYVVNLLCVHFYDYSPSSARLNPELPSSSWQEHEDKYRDNVWLAALQSALGSSIDTVEAEMGGATRQVLMLRHSSLKGSTLWGRLLEVCIWGGGRKILSPSAWFRFDDQAMDCCLICVYFFPWGVPTDHR